MGRAWVCWPSSMTCYRQGLVLGRTAVKQHQIFLWFSLLLNMERRKAREGKKEKQETNWRCKSPSMETKQNKKPHVFSRNSQAHRKGLHREWPQVLPDRMPSQQFSSTQHIVFPCCVICSLTLFFLFYKLLPRSHHLPLPLAPGNHSIFLEGVILIFLHYTKMWNHDFSKEENNNVLFKYFTALKLQFKVLLEPYVVYTPVTQQVGCWGRRMERLMPDQAT